MSRFVVVMPAFNEAEGIKGFLQEVVAAFPRGHVGIIVVDDASTDRTADVLREAASSGLPVEALTNPNNVGHGPSTVRALRLGLRAAADVVVAVDGDGQFTGPDIARVANMSQAQGVVVEGCRTGRDDPSYRRLVSAMTRMLVGSFSARAVRDANTPLRAYPVEVLEGLLSRLPDDALTPNLLISSMLRRQGTPVLELEVQSLPRRGVSAVGTTWGRTARLLPNRRFLSFCRRSLQQWFAYRRL